MGKKTTEEIKRLCCLEDELNEVADNIVVTCKDYLHKILDGKNCFEDIPEEVDIMLPAGVIDSDEHRIYGVFKNVDGDLLFKLDDFPIYVDTLNWQELMQVVEDFDNQLGI